MTSFQTFSIREINRHVMSQYGLFVRMRRRQDCKGVKRVVRCQKNFQNKLAATEQMFLNGARL